MMMRTKALAVVAAMTMAGIPGAAEEEGQGCDNRGYFETLLTTVPEGHPEAGRQLSPDEFSETERFELERGVELLARQAGDICIETMIAGADETGVFPAASDHYMLYEFFMHDEDLDVFCNQGMYVGNGGHYDIAEPVPEELAGDRPWSDGRTEYVGKAQSDLSIRTDYYRPSPPVFYYTDLETGKSFSYNQEIAYGGISDFFCLSYWFSFINQEVNINMPVGSGAVVPAPTSLP